MGCWWVDGIPLLLLYSYVIIIPFVHGWFAAAATAAATAAASASVVLWLSSRWFGFRRCSTCSSSVCSCYYSYDKIMVPRVRIYNMPQRSSSVVVLTRGYVATPVGKSWLEDQKTDVLYLIRSSRELVVERGRVRVSWWGEQHHQRG